MIMRFGINEMLSPNTPNATGTNNETINGDIRKAIVGFIETNVIHTPISV